MKKISFLLIIILFFSCGLQSYASTDGHRKKVGLVLSGGGAKGMAHIGALKVIEEAGIPIDYVVGTSMGSIIGGLYAIGYTPTQMDSMVRIQDWQFLLSDRILRKDKNMGDREREKKYQVSLPFSLTKIKRPAGGLIKGENISNLFSELTIGYHDSIDFNKLPIPFACVSEDIAEGTEVVFHSGVLATAMRSSMAIPGVFTPVRLHNKVLVDGGVVNNYPVDVAKAMGADVVIGIDVQSNLKPANELNNTADVLGQLVNLMGKDLYEKNVEKTNTYIKVDVEGYSAASFNRSAIDTLIIRGEQAARMQLESLRKLKKEIGLPASYSLPKKKSYKPQDTLLIHKVTFNNSEIDGTNWLMRKCKLKDNSSMSIETIKKATAIIRANTSYTSASYKLTKADSNRYDLKYHLGKKQENVINLGVKYDTEENASLLLNLRTTLKTKVPSYISATGRLGKRYGGKLSYGIEPSPLSAVELAYRFMYNDINYYYEGKKRFNSTWRYHAGEISYYNVWLKNMRFGVGLRYELYDYKDFLVGLVTDKNGQTPEIDTEHFFTYLFQLHYDSFDKAYFPSKGLASHIAYNIYTDNLLKYKDERPFSSLLGAVQGVIPVTHRFSILPSAYGRFLIGKRRVIPYSKMNTIGGDTPAQYLPEQLPFPGTVNVELMDNSLIVGGLKFRQRVGSIHYLTLSTNYALSSNRIKDIFKEQGMFGCSVGYGLDSMFGPLEASFNYTNQSKKLRFFINLGYHF